MKNRSVRDLACAAFLVALLAGCGGRVDDSMAGGQVPENFPPASASATTAGMVAYTATLTATPGDGSAVVDLSSYALPGDASDTAELVVTPNDDPSGLI